MRWQGISLPHAQTSEEKKDLIILLGLYFLRLVVWRGDFGWLVVFVCAAI